MVFSSLLFLTIFLPLTVGLYNILPKKARNFLLLLVSLVFYAWGEPTHIFIMLITTFYIWVFGLVVARAMKQGKQGVARFFLVLTLVLSLGTLMVFKYTGFFVSNLPFLQNTALGSLEIALPIGISFYTFQALSYIIDVYRGDVKAQKSYFNFAMYISLFPQLIAGPIVRYADVEDQIDERTVTIDGVASGIQRFVLGLGKKVLLANQIGVLWETMAGNGSVLGAWLGAVAFAFQIYFDFSAYSDMAIGLGRMFGFKFTENFRYPYQSGSITEFWRRWHMTLGTWFREYVYIPLGGNRKGKLRQLFNLLVVWFLTGFWHGAAWQFIFWGLYYFVFLAAEKLFLLKPLQKAPAVLRHGYALLVVVLGWVLFACEDVTAAFGMYKTMLGIGAPLADSSAVFYLGGSVVMLLICTVGATELPKLAAQKLQSKLPEPVFRHVTYAVLALILFASMAFLVADSYNPFLYFRF